MSKKLKKIIEKRDALYEKVEGIIAKAEEEVRSFTEEEKTEKDDALKEMRELNEVIKTEEEKRDLDIQKGKEKREETKTEESADVEERAFEEYIRGEERAVTKGANGGIIPTTIANRIIKAVEDICPIYARAEHFNLKGKLVFAKGSKMSANYVTEGQAVAESDAAFTTVQLDDFVVGVLSKISNSLVNNTEFDIVSYVVTEVAASIARFLEKEMLYGTGENRIQGLINGENQVESEVKLNADVLIDAQLKVKQIYQKDACWVMNSTTLGTIRKLKDTTNNYILKPSGLHDGFDYTLLDKPVFISDQAENLEAGKTPIFYGDLFGYKIKLSKNVEIQLLKEKYAEYYQTGVVGFIECDGNIVEEERLVMVKVKAA